MPGEAGAALFGLVVLIHLAPLPLWIGFHSLRRAADWGES